jgi:hypothetical protein
MRQEFTVCQIKSHFSIVCRFSLFSLDVMSWFIQESGHPGYNKTLIPEVCPHSFLVEDPETRNNTDDPASATLANYEGGTFVFSSAQDP